MTFINKIKYHFARIYIRLRLRLKILSVKEIGESRPRLIIMNVPSHGNLGDHLIAFAEIKFLNDYFEKSSIAFTTGEHLYGFDLIKKFIEKNDIIFISGGGYLGSLWPSEESRVREIINCFLNNKIIIMPQTVFYESDICGNNLFEETSNIFKNHKDLKIMLREKWSYEFVKNRMKVFSSGVSLYPDMSFYLKDSLLGRMYKREGILFCLRNDKESIVSLPELIRLTESLKENYKIDHIDTQAIRTVTLKNSEREIKKLAGEFAKAKVVVTDRLHGLIFSILTKTPVVALDSLSHKIKNYGKTWLKSIPHIVPADNLNKLPKLISDLYKIKEEEIIIPDFSEFFKLMADEIYFDNHQCL